MKEIYLVRHGQAIDDVESLYGGAADHEPTEHSLNEAERFSEKFKSKGIDVVISSPYQRAKEPAKIVADKLDIPLIIESDLRERNQYGILTGMKKEEAAQKYPEMVEALKKPASQIEGGEDNQLFRERVRNVIEKIWQRPEGKILVFTHLGSILAALNLHFTDLEVEHYGWLKITKQNNTLKILESEKVEFN